MGTDPTSVSYSVRGVPGDKLRAWRQVVGSVFVNLDMEIEGGPRFRGEMVHSALDELDVVWALADGEIVRRTRRHIAGNPSDSCVVMLVRQGAVRITQFGRTAEVAAGSFSMLDLDAPYFQEHSGLAESYFLKLPNALSARRFAEIRNHCAVVRPVTGGVGGIAADLIESLCRNAGGADAATAPKLAGQILDIVTLAFEAGPGDEPEGPSLARNAIRRRAMAFMDRHLGNSGLDVAEIAAGVGVSVRYLHRCFADTGASVGETLRLRRLTLCRERLADPRYDRLRISDLARRHGFVSQSHFAASFRKQFEQTARAIRGEARARRRADG
jgi:AraC-like DNA-binding protein